MLEELCKTFIKNRTQENVYKIVRHCREKKFYSIGSVIGSNIANEFPTLDFLYELALCLYYAKRYTESHDQYLKILSNDLSFDNAKSVLFNAHFCINHISNRYNSYNKTIVDRLCEKQKTPNLSPKITLTMTTCKRYELFEQTINSFLNCADVDRIDVWLCVDDNSSQEDRKKMYENYPFFNFYFKKYSEKGHPQSMNIIKQMVQTPYIFHLEDDWKFYIKRDYISDCLKVLDHDQRLGQCLINKNYAETESDIDVLGGFPHKTKNNLRYFVHEYAPTNNDLLDFYKRHGNGKQSAYWPHFSLRPSLLRKEILNEIGDFDETVSHFEMVYARKYSKKYKSAFLENIHAIHIGRLTKEINDTTKLNAYILNDEKQFSGKEKEIKKKSENIGKIPSKPSLGATLEKVVRFGIRVINLDRRPDRWEKFQKNRIGFNYTRFSAVDGNKLKPNEQLSRIFDGNDYKMRTGMVGCAMSHISILVDLINGDSEFNIVLEDDIEIAPCFSDKLRYVLSAVNNDWDLIFLGHHYYPEFKIDPILCEKDKVPTVEKWNRIKSLKESIGGTGGYIVSKKGAEKLLNYINDHGMINCIDTMMQKAIPCMNTYYCTPHLVHSECFYGDNKVDSDIQFCYNSLEEKFSDRFSRELEYYKNDALQTLVNLDQAVTIAISQTILNKVYVYKTDDQQDLTELLKICKHPRYTLDNKVIFIVTNPSDYQKQRYFHKFKKGDIFNIEDALQY